MSREPVIEQFRDLERTGVMESVGADLRSRRESKHVSLSDVAQSTRISINHLKSIEEGNYKALPGGMYNRAFLKSYCDYLNLDPAEYLARYEKETYSPTEKAARSKVKMPQQPGNGLTVHPLAAWAVMFLVSVIGLYFSRNWISAVFSPYFAKSPATALPLPSPPPPVPEPVPKPNPPQQQATDSIPVQTAANPTEESKATASPADSKADAPPSQPSSSGNDASEATSVPKMKLEFEALEKCWVSVNSDGNRLVKLLAPGETQSFAAVERFYVVLGNAGGVKMKINGKAAKPLGKRGEVVRMLINEQNIEDLIEKINE
jgi:cytoskeleton protein RodZ